MRHALCHCPHIYMESQSTVARDKLLCQIQSSELDIADLVPEKNFVLMPSVCWDVMSFDHSANDATMNNKLEIFKCWSSVGPTSTTLDQR